MERLSHEADSCLGMAARSPEESGRPQDALASAAATASPVEATLRILQSSVPYLIGAAVVRQGVGAGTVAAQVGRVPWLFDRRLTQLELSDDALPPNQAVFLDWPVPHQAEWVGVPPRLLIARLVAFEKTVGVLLGTLLTREQLEPKTREAIELSCQLVASAVATEQLVRAGERQSRRLRVLNDLQRALSSTLDARALGRVLRETMVEVMEHAAFAVSLFHPQREEVAYRYRVVEMDALANELGRRPVDDGPNSRAARRAERVVFAREVEIPDEREPGRTVRQQVSVVQFPLRANEAPIGIVTVQAFRPEGFSEDELEIAQAVVETSANYFAHARRIGLRKPGPEEPRFTLVTGTGPVAPAPESPAAAAEDVAGPEPVSPSPPKPALPGAVERNADAILKDLLAECGALGQPHAFVVLADEGSGLLRGHVRSDAPFMADFDDAVGLSRGTFVVGMDDRANAIARACREARVVSVAWVYEVIQPVLSWQDALVLERLAGGGRCTVVPMRVGGSVSGALVLGPSPDDVPEALVERIAGLVEAAASELAAVWRAASLAGGVAAPTVPEETVLRLSALRELGPTA